MHERCQGCGLSCLADKEGMQQVLLDILLFPSFTLVAAPLVDRSLVQLLTSPFWKGSTSPHIPHTTTP
jgi:hypothetical protein